MVRRHTGRLHALSVAFLLAVVTGCGGSDATSPEPPEAQNRAPTASATATPTEVPENDGNVTVVTLDGSGSTDPDGDALTYSWSVPGGTFVNGTSASSQVAQVTLPGTAAVTATLTVSDGRGGTAEASVTITLSAPSNQAPTASATADPAQVPQNDNARTTITLDGSGSSDPDGDALTYSWSVPGATFVNGTSTSSQVAQVTLPGTSAATATLTVSDGRGGSDQASASIALGARIVRDDPSFAVDIQEVLNRRGCSAGGCHGSAQSAGLDLRTGSSYANLVNVASSSEGTLRVIPGDADGSYIVIKLEGRQSVGAQMPRGSSPLNATDLQNIKNWINKGAKNN